MSRDEIAGMLIENADEPYAEEIAKAISIQQKKKADQDNDGFTGSHRKALSFLPKAEQKEAVKKSSQRSFQALRIDVNSEYEVLESFLESLPDILAPGGRVAILTSFREKIVW